MESLVFYILLKMCGFHWKGYGSYYRTALISGWRSLCSGAHAIGGFPLIFIKKERDK